MGRWAKARFYGWRRFMGFWFQGSTFKGFNVQRLRRLCACGVSVETRHGTSLQRPTPFRFNVQRVQCSTFKVNRPTLGVQRPWFDYCSGAMRCDNWITPWHVFTETGAVQVQCSKISAMARLYKMVGNARLKIWRFKNLMTKKLQYIL